VPKGPDQIASDNPAVETNLRHIPVMLAEVVAALDPCDGGIYVDGTFGAGGYSEALLTAADTKVIAIDRDPEALRSGRALQAAHGASLLLAEGCFGELDRIAAGLGHDAVDGVVLDIGVSSMQIDTATRGFSFAKDGPLDMRMAASGMTAAQVVNTADEDDLANLIFRLGEERRSRAVARAIVRRRQVTPFSRTLDLADIVRRAVGGAPGRIHPATRTFQALRIYVNAELDELARGLSAAERLLKPGGRLAVVTFHSLEDRIAKRFFQARCGRGGRASRHRPLMEAGPAVSFISLPGLAKKAGMDEIKVNPRARSARLRAAIRSPAPAWPEDHDTLGLPDVKMPFTG